MTPVSIITYQAKYLSAFVELNQQWIEHYFELEAMDLAQLRNPDEYILNPGGEIFFAIRDSVPIGTCAMVPHGPRTYEIAKMAVMANARGQGIGDRLMERCLEWAREKGAARVMLLSNTKLEPAIKLYKKHGFKVIHLGEHPDYARCNIEMAIELESIEPLEST